MDQTKQPDLFETNTLVFGVHPAPFEAQFVSQEHALDLKDAYPLAVDTVLNSTYMDNSMDLVTEKNCGIKLYQEPLTLWRKANMHARKWLFKLSKSFGENVCKSMWNEVDLLNQ